MTVRGHGSLRATTCAVMVILLGIVRFQACPWRKPSPRAPLGSGMLNRPSSPLSSSPIPFSRRGPEGIVRAGPPTMLHLDMHHTNRSPFRAPHQPKLLWAYDTGGPIAAAPLIVNDNNVVVASLSGKVIAINAIGKVQWETDLKERVYSSPLLLEDTLFLGVDKGNFIALNASSGALRFRFHVEGDADTAPAPLPSGGLVFAAEKTVYALRTDGTVLWRYRVKQKVFSSPTVADDGTVIFGSQDDTITALRTDGTALWKVSVGADADAAPVIDDKSIVYTGTDKEEVIAMRIADGLVLWRSAVGGFVRGPLSVTRDGLVLAATYGPVPAVVALAPENGAELFRFSIPGTGAKEFGIHGAPLEDSAGTLVFGAQDDAIYALNRDGSLSWRVAVGADVDATVILAADGLLYAGCDDGKLYAWGETPMDAGPLSIMKHAS